MPRLIVTIDIPEDQADRTTSDPHDCGQDIVDAYNETARANGQEGLSFVNAEWTD